MSRPHRPTPKPWPMRWVVLAIAAFIVLYTAINLFYRKPGRGHEPYAEARARAAAARLQAAGWEKLPVADRRPVEKPAAGAAFRRGAPGIDLDLLGAFPQAPTLFATIDRVAAPAAVARGADCTAYFTASVADQEFQLGGLQLFHHDDELVLVPSLERLPAGGLLSRWHDADYCATFSTAALAPGTYRVRIVAAGPAAEWTLTIR